jgi:hypothetical protein
MKSSDSASRSGLFQLQVVGKTFSDTERAQFLSQAPGFRWFFGAMARQGGKVNREFLPTNM